MSRIYCPTLGALTDLHVSNCRDGDVAWVETLEDEFVLHRVSTLDSADGITIVAPKAGAPVAGYPLAAWYRKQLQSQRWRWQYAWGLDPSGGNDENSGSPNAPLASFAELQRRVGGTLLLNPNGLDVTVLSDTTEAVILDMQSPSGVSTVYFHAALPSILYIGTIGSYTSYDSASGQSSALHDASLPGSYGDWVGHLGRILTGPRAGTEFIIVAALASSNLRVSEPMAAPFSSEFVTPQAGDTYAVYDTLVRFGANADMPSTVEMHGGPGAQVAFQWLELGAPGIHRFEHKGGGFFASGCTINGFDVGAGPADRADLFGCSVVGGLRVNGGGADLVAGTADNVQARFGTIVNAQRTVVQGSYWEAEAGSQISVADWIAVFDTAIGMIVGSRAHLDLTSGSLFGSGITATGVSVAGGGFVGISGAASLSQLQDPAVDCQIGSDAVAYGSLPYTASNGAAIVVP